jgi:hypothetical protein
VAADHVRFAMEVTQRSAGNITAALEACDLWQTILEKEDRRNGDESAFKNALTPFVRVICLELQASCFVRVGKQLARSPSGFERWS